MARRLAERTGAASLPVSSATLGLLIGVAALRSEGGGLQALVPSFTFPATVQAIIWNGMHPVFVDIDPRHWHMSPDALMQALDSGGKDVGMVVACSAFGTPPPAAVRRAWQDVCGSAGVPLLVDSAAGFGGIGEDGVAIGAQGDVEVVSFHATKPLAIGEGGAVFTRDPQRMEKLARLANFGLDISRQALEPWGLNAKLDELHAAVALAALDDFDGHLTARRERTERLLKDLGPLWPAQLGYERGTSQFVSVLALDAKTREQVLGRGRGVAELRTYYTPLHRAPAFERLPRSGSLEVTEDLGRRILSLPMSVDLSDEERQTVVEVVLGTVP
jgi:dTDP-4-amino-4,6-dideoxygalactose transaminase